ncbi:MAG: flagellar motor switch protein FliN [Deltaproteobacteria bacterium]|nr:flagellar motor switch protein FliN [Deltaproteobacteria bacterium]MBW2050835.1 flagellar motor switch protein FliN [Deltaproteobacteria bacterium]MBW2140059.1 flagellar motor switch protein FliN [Deltaproteobacteria bacterium]MBW2322075.1 flagellar motor switch protein FliN [Deltaproteobacteria bacterium]
MTDDQILDQGDIDKLMSDDESLSDDWDDSLEEGIEPAKEQPPGKDAAQEHRFDSLEGQAQKPEGQTRQLDFILDIPLEVTVELGRTKMLINDLLQLGQGSVIELDKLAGEPLEILINNKLVARGEVVVINEKFGVRLTDIISPMERVQSLT